MGGQRFESFNEITDKLVSKLIHIHIYILIHKLKKKGKRKDISDSHSKIYP